MDTGRRREVVCLFIWSPAPAAPDPCRSAQKVSAFSMITFSPSFPHRPYTRFTIPSGVLMIVYLGLVQSESWKNVISPSTLSVGVLTGVSSPHPARKKQRSRTRRGRGDPKEGGSQVFWVSVFSIGLVGLGLVRALLGRLRCVVLGNEPDDGFPLSSVVRGDSNR